jgi:hypothetical protein
MRRERQTLDQRISDRALRMTSAVTVVASRFIMAPAGTPKSEALVIRCDGDGEIWVSIGRATAS